jgi:DNA-binding transcriptional LysR family regulator
VRPRLFVGSIDLARRAALAGLGIVPSMRLEARAYKQLVAVLEDWTPPAFEVNALFARGRALLPKTRAMIDLLAAWFAKNGGRV